jgi:phospholipid/cholesterol/gamma-HCH transport system permease protein
VPGARARATIARRVQGGAYSIHTEERDGRLRLRFAGRLTLADGGALWRQLLDGIQAGAFEVDVAEVHLLDGGAAALLLAARAEAAARGRGLEIVGAAGDAAKLLQLYASAHGRASEKPPPGRRSVLEQIGDATVDVAREFQRTLAFVGDLAAGLVAALRRPRSVQFADVAMLMERAGADGLPIVAVINFLVGMILGLQGAIQLHRFAADPFLANLVGLSVVRELGPLMTAILVAGRSGAAYAAELGTMTVNEEVDALRTIGQDPQRFLVFPRVLSLLLVVPLLTVLADVVGCLGGQFVAGVKLGIPPIAYLQQLQRAIDVSDVLTGLIKSGAFAALIGLVACQRGLAARGGAQGVGAATTSAVVVVLFGLVALDALFTFVFTLLGW